MSKISGSQNVGQGLSLVNLAGNNYWQENFKFQRSFVFMFSNIFRTNIEKENIKSAHLDEK